MGAKVITVKCPNCDGAVDTGQKTCVYCKQPVVISTFSSIYEMPTPLLHKYAGAYKKLLLDSPDNNEFNNSIAMCYLKLGLYEEAYEAFRKTIEGSFDNSETYFYAAICLLGGKKAFSAAQNLIEKIEKYILSAIKIEPKGIYWYFLAYIKYDYFERKYFNTTPNYKEVLARADSCGVSPFDIEQLYGILGVSRPDAL
ncbi:MAG: hypothetical protein LBC99_02540 [Spirochaetota bacterium]|jgi:tetratricopeptide (TPR) repeat protein|nr:hypothetical protein [Spirochaetota bacterium]